MSRPAASDSENLLFQPAGLFRNKHLAVLENGEKISIRFLWIPREAEITIGNRLCRIVNEYSSSQGNHKGWKLLMNDKPVAWAKKTDSLWGHQFKITEPQFSLEVTQPSAFEHSFDFVYNSRVIGSLKGANFNPAKRKISVSCPSFVPLHLRLFALALVVFTWRPDSNIWWC